MFSMHDIGIIIQFILLIPVVLGFYKISQQRTVVMSRSMLSTGVLALSFVVLFLLLIFPKFLADYTCYLKGYLEFGWYCSVLVFKIYF